MMIVNFNDRYYNVNVESIVLNVIAFVFTFVSMFDGWEPLFAGIGLWIFDAIKFPYPNIYDVTDEMYEVDDDDGPDDLNTV